MRKFAVVGSPISHSLSPNIFNGISNLLNIDSHYTRICSSSFEDALELAKKLNIEFLNITSPYKSDVATCIENKNEIDLRLFNSLFINNHKGLVANNTDIDAFNTIINNCQIPKNSRLLILGGGDTAFLSYYQLNKLKYNNITIAVREGLRAQFESNIVNTLNLIELDSLMEYDVLINTIPKSEINFEFLEYKPNLILIDTIYHKPFLNNLNVKYIGGVDWLILQAIPNISKLFNIELLASAVHDTLKIKQHKTVVLSGMMACGKSLVSKELHSSHNIKSADLDGLIAKYTNKTSAQIIREDGINQFREIEFKILENAVKSNKYELLSLGGGTLTHPKAAQFVNLMCYNIWVYSDFDLIQDRLARDKTDRPLLDTNNLTEIYYSRELTYYKYSDLIVENSNNVTSTIRRIHDEMLNLL
ncbi:hypothetical protein MASR1M45_01250 [Candidatus Kapaibacterium sp.]